jgi:hypothetical protein
MYYSSPEVTYNTNVPGVGVRVPVGARLSPLHVVQTGSGTRLDADALSQGVKLTANIQLTLSSRICGAIHPLPHTSSWRSA